MAPTSSTTFDKQHVVTWSSPTYTVASGDISGASSSTVFFTSPTPTGGNVVVNGDVTYEYIAGVNDNNGVILKNGSTYFLFTNQTVSSGDTGNADTAEDLEPVCLMAGTEIPTVEGIKLVEDLVVGDLVLTSSGEYIPVRWIGVQTVSTVFNSKAAFPVKISKDALGLNKPNKDLYVSQNHAVFIDDTLFSAIALVNGKTITMETSVPETLKYYGIDLGPATVHPVQNLDVGSLGSTDRSVFDNYSEWVELDLEEIDEPLLIPRIRTGLQFAPSITQTA